VREWSVAVVVELPVGTALTLIGGSSWWGEWQLRITLYRVPPPHHSIYSTGDRGPPASEQLVIPDQGADKVVPGTLGSGAVEINPNKPHPPSTADTAHPHSKP
jgi:hypothetical protein